MMLDSYFDHLQIANLLPKHDAAISLYNKEMDDAQVITKMRNNHDIANLFDTKSMDMML